MATTAGAAITTDNPATSFTLKIKSIIDWPLALKAVFGTSEVRYNTLTEI